MFALLSNVLAHQFVAPAPAADHQGRAKHVNALRQSFPRPTKQDTTTTSGRWWKHDRLLDILGADLRSLAALRIVLALVVLIDVAGRLKNLTIHYTDQGVLQRDVALEHLSQWRWSVMLINGTTQFQMVLFAVTAAAAIGMMLGYRTRTMTILVWVMVMSIQVRNPLVLSGGDTLLRVLLFWAMFLPLGAWWSLDARRRSDGEKLSTRFISFATIGIFLQIAFMYWFTAILKSGDAWRSDGTALYYALSAQEVTRDFGQYLTQFEGLLKVLSWGSLGLEIVAPILLFSPIFTGPVRTFAALSVMAFQFGIFLTMDLGIFPWTSALCMVVFLPAWFWDTALPRVQAAVLGRFAVARRFNDSVLKPGFASLSSFADRTPQWRTSAHFSLSGNAAMPAEFPGRSARTATTVSRPATEKAISKSRPVMLRSSMLTNLVAAAMLVFVFFWNIATVSSFAMPDSTLPVAYGAGLYQNWAMFAPQPPRTTTWYVYRGITEDGQQIELIPPIVNDDLSMVREVSWSEPADISGDIYGDKYWRKYLSAVAKDSRELERRSFAGYICRTWNGHYGGDARLVGFQVILMSKKTLPDNKEAPIKRKLIDEYKCG